MEVVGDLGLTQDVGLDYTDFLAGCTQRSLDLLLIQVVAAGQAAPPSEVRTQAMHTLDYAFQLPAIWQQVRQLLLTLAPKMEQAGHRSEWLTLLDLAIEQSRHQRDSESEGELLYQRAILHRLQGRFAEADESLNAAALLFEQLGDALRLSRALSRRAFLAWLRRDLLSAGQLVRDAAALLPAADASREETAYCLLVRGLLAIDLGEAPAAVTHYDQAIELWRVTGNQRMLAICYSNQANAFLASMQYDSAIANYRQAQEILNAIGDATGWAISTMNIGQVMNEMRQPDGALVHFTQVEPIFRRTGDQMRLAELYGNQGESLRYLARWAEAEQACLLSIEIWRRLDNTESLVNGLDNLGAVLIAQGRRTDALAALHEALALLHTIPDDPLHDKHLRTVTEKLRLAEQLSGNG